MPTNKTHDPAAKSWVDSANADTTDFPIQNLPYGVFSVDGGDKHIGVAIGDQILDLTVIEQRGLVRPDGARTVFDRAEINAFMALGPGVWRDTRAVIFDLLDAGSGDLRDDTELRRSALVAMSDATMHLPVFVRSYTDFYASKEHATNVGTMFRGPDNALPPNWLHIPIGYNGRASTVVVSGTDVRRPWGQLKAPDAAAPRFAPCERLDIELELGAIVGTPTELGETLTVAEAYDKIFGYVLLNDWSARDIQTWEYQPLGPFQSKATATTISPWVVTRDALEPFRVATPERVEPLLPYLHEATPNNFDIEMEIILSAGGRDTTVSRTNYRGMYFSCAQQLAHHATSGCAMCIGDLLGSGTISGAEPGSYGSLLELSWGGKEPVVLADGTERSFLADGDRVTFKAHCASGGARIGFGTCAGTVRPAIEAWA
ncbi:MAG: fumarylacetoacetase [Hyphomicrobiaceae bacterium]